MYHSPGIVSSPSIFYQIVNLGFSICSSWKPWKQCVCCTDGIFLSETHPSDYFKLYGNEHHFLATIFPLFVEAQMAWWSSKTVADVQDDGDNDNIAWVAAAVYMTVTFGLTLLVMKFVDIVMVVTPDHLWTRPLLAKFSATAGICAETYLKQASTRKIEQIIQNALQFHSLSSPSSDNNTNRQQALILTEGGTTTQDLKKYHLTHPKQESVVVYGGRFRVPVSLIENFYVFL
jgi:hypothetical protein